MNINANKIKELEIPYCSIDEQKKILQKIKELTPVLENTLEKI
jgi:restriction endonuclease S subunit